jgi:uncharacterized repeat protein (TIGR02543 family)
MKFSFYSLSTNPLPQFGGIMKHFTAILLALCAILLIGSMAFGQSLQVIGSFPQMDGGFEAQTTGVLTSVSSIATGVQSTVWTTSSTNLGTIIASNARTGSKYMNMYTTSTAKRWQSPTASSGVITNTPYTIQYYYRINGSTTGTAKSMQLGISPDGTGTPTYSPGTTPYDSLPPTNGAWVKYQKSITPAAGAAGKYGIGIIRANTPTMVTAVDADDFVMYAGAADNTAPDPITAPVISAVGQTQQTVGWTAPGTGVDGGGYMVVRGLVDPATTPNVNGIYAIGNTVNTGETVVYIGTATSFVDAGLTMGTHYYYRIYTVDKAFNYSTSVGVDGSTTSVTTYTLSISATNGTVAKNPDQANYASGTGVTLTPTASTGYHFVNWSGDVISGHENDNPLSLTMDADKNLTANFAINTYTLTLNAVNGSVAKNPDQSIFDYNTTVQLTPTANANYHFSGWTGDVVAGHENDNPLTVTFDANKTITANFALDQYTITPSVAGIGTITPSTPQAVNFGTDQAFIFAPGTGQHFDSLLVDGVKNTDSTASYTFITVSAPHTIEAFFSPNQYAINITAVNGSVAKAPDQATYAYGTPVQLTPTPDPTYAFVNWSGDVPSGHENDNPLSVTVDAAKNITANFASNTKTITAAVSGPGTITPSGAVSVAGGASQQFTFSPNTGANFDSLVVDGVKVDSNATYTFTDVQAAHTITAYFTAIQYSLTINAAHGTVAKDPDQATYTYGTVVQLTATGATGFHFTSWSGDLTGTTNPASITMDGNKTVTAGFAIDYAQFRSHQSGNWSDVAAWDRFDGDNWINPASAAPTAADGAVEIQGGHTITVAASLSADQVKVDAGGILAVAAGQTLTVADAADSIDLDVSGTLNNFGTVTATGRVAFNNGGTYIHSFPAGAGAALPSSTWRDGSTCRIDSTTGTNPTNLNTQNLYNLIINATTMGANGGPNFPNNYILRGDLTLMSSKSLQWRMANVSGGETRNITINGNVNVNGSTAILTSTGSGADTAAHVNITVNGNVNLSAGVWNLNNSGSAYAEWFVKGNVSITGGTFNSSASGWYGRRTLNFSGGGSQTYSVVSPGVIGTGTLQYKISGGSVLTLNFPLSITNASGVNIVNGQIVTTSTNLLTLGATASLIGGSSTAYVNGPLALNVASTSATTKFFPIGKGSNYRPVTIIVNQDAATATPYTAEMFNAAPPTYTLPSALAGVSSVRYYTISKGSGANLAAGVGATVQLNYDTDDNVTNSTILRIAKDSAGSWLNLGGSGTANTTGSITSNAFYSFSNFALAIADTTVQAVVPVVTTTSISGISTTFASGGGNVVNDGGAAVSARGVCWNTTGSPTVADFKTTDGNGAGIFTSSLTSLTPGATYYVRAYATNTAGTGYGTEVSFSTLSALVPPTVTTTAVSNIQTTTAVSGGNVTEWGGDPVTARGICWSLSADPTTTDAHSTDGSGLGSYASGMSQLIPATIYHVRAYATNGAGTGYGADVQFTSATPAPDTTLVVAKDGSGNYLTVQAAFNAVPLNYTGHWTIFVKKGTYYEKDTLVTGKINVSLIGEDRDSTIITYDDYGDRYGSGVPGTSGTFTIAIDASDFTAKNITFRNTYAPQTGVVGTQAVALRTQGDRHEYINCRILGYQDTYYTYGGSGTGRMYHKNCFIEGTVDFIFGRNIVVFDSCTIHEIRNAATITAGSTDASSSYGYVFRNCTILTDSIGYDATPITTSYLGRPWQGAPRTVFINTYEPSSLVAAGWQSWNVTPALYGEFNNYGPGSGTSGRVAWSSQLTGPAASAYSLSNIFAKSSAASSLILYDWMPVNGTQNLPLLYRVTASAGANGSISSPGTTNVVYNGAQSYTIAPATGYHVADVLVDGSSVGAVTSYPFSGITGNHTISASFAINTYALNITAVNGTVTKNPDLTAYDSASVVQLSPVPASGYHFVNWSGDVAVGHENDNPLSLTMNAAKNITANFDVNPPSIYTLTVGGTNGSVTKTPDSTSYTAGTQVVLHAVPAFGYHFVDWSGSISGSVNPDTVKVDSNMTATANFAINQYALTAASAGNGTVAKSPDSTLYTHGTIVQVTATPSAGYHFAGWSGDTTSAVNPISIAMTSAKSITASFAANSLVKFTNGTGGGSWNSTATWLESVIPVVGDSVVISGTDSVWVASLDSCGGLNVLPGAKIGVSAKLVPTNLTLGGSITVTADTLKPTGTANVTATGIYRHARDGGKMLVATWDNNSTVMFTGLVSTAPANSKQTFGNVVWNCPSQTGSINLGWHPTVASIDTTLYINGSVTVVSTGTGRWQLAAPLAGSSSSHTIDRINIAGGLNLQGGTFTSNGTSNGYGDIIITIAGNVDVTGTAQFAFTRGSQGGTGTTSWIFKNNFHLGPLATTANSNAVGAKWIFSKPGLQTVTVDSGFIWNGADNFQFGDGTTATTVDIGNSQLGGSACIQVVKANAHLIVGQKGSVGGGTNTNSVASTFTLENGAKLTMAQQKGILASGSSGTVQVSGTRSYGTGAVYEYNGTSAQTTGGGLPATVAGLVINNAAGVSIDSTATVNVTDSLSFQNGLLYPGTNLVYIASTGTVHQTNGYVVGPMKAGVAAGSGITKLFAIGDSTKYAPVSLTFANVTTGGDLQVSTTSAAHPQIASSPVNPAKSVTRYYTVANTGTAFTTYDATFGFVPADLTAGADPAHFIVGKYDSPSWSAPATGLRTATSTQATGMTSFSDFAIGDPMFHTITASAGPNGTIVPAGAVLVADGQDTTFTFVPASGYHVDSVFVNGSYAGSSLTYKYTNVLLDGTINVVFKVNPIDQFALHLNAVNGTIQKNPDLALYLYGTTVQLTPVPATGYHFTGWSDSLTGTTVPGSIVMNAEKTVTAHFALNQYALNVTVAGSGSVTKNPDLALYDTNSVVQLTAIPATGYHFTGWSGSATGTTNPLNVTMNATKNITATFAIDVHTLTITALNGTVGLVPAGESYDYGTVVHLTATPATGYHFTGWTGDLTSTNNPDSVVMTSGKNITAVFTINTYTLTTPVVGTGIVAKSPDLPVYPHGTVDTLTATAPKGWIFSAWSGDVTGTTNPLLVTMDGAKNITATFILDPLYQVQYRTFRPDSTGASVDNKGKQGKYVVRKNVAVDFTTTITSPVRPNTGLLLKASMVSTAVVKNAANAVIGSWTAAKGATITGIDTNATITITGRGTSGKAIKIDYVWTHATKPTTTKGTAVVASILRLPMPNRINVLAETMAEGGYGSTGMIVGQVNADVKNYGWFQTVKYGDVLKTVDEKGTFQTGTAHGFDKYISGKPVLKQNKSLPPSKFNDVLLANMIGLKLSITASAMKKTPAGLGELIYDDGTVNVLNGKMVKEIAAYADSVMMGWTTDTIVKTKTLKNHHFADPTVFANVNTAIANILNAFEGPVDTVKFGDTLRLKGTQPLLSATFLKANTSVMPAIITPLALQIPQEPTEYSLNQNYPNPFNPTTTIGFDLPEDAIVTLKIYNILGQEVATLLDRALLSGGTTQEMQFDAHNMASGVYFYRITVEKLDENGNATSGIFSTTKKMMLVK